MKSFTTRLSEDSKQKLSALLAQGELQQALDYALLLKNFHPDEPLLYDYISTIWLAGNQPQNALENAEKALELDADFASAHANKGMALRVMGKPADALKSCKTATHLDPKNGSALLNAGDLCVILEHYDDAVEYYDALLSLEPNSLAAHSNRGVALRKLNRLDEALASCTKALAINPKHANTLVSKGSVLFDSGRREEAVQCYHSALELEPNHINARQNLGSILLTLGKYEEGILQLDAVLKKNPDNAVAQSNKSHALLAMGNFKEGWPGYEWRLHKKDYTLAIPDNIPRWRGEDLSGTKILLLADQGLGDQIQFSRYTNNLAEQGARIHLECDPKLASLFKNSLAVDTVNNDHEAASADFYCPLSSLAGHFKEDLTRPHKTPYIFANEQLIQNWRSQFEAIKRFRIGASWQGNPTFRNDRWRSFALSNFSAIAQLEDAQLISLQKGDLGVSQIPGFRQKHQIIDIEELTGKETNLDDAAAVIMNLDLVITSCTGIAHLAGALGVPTWIVLGKVADWRWQLDSEDTAWYPNARLFRQTETGNWESVFSNMAKHLRTMMDQKNNV